MDMYKKASRMKLRYVTTNGNLTIEQLWKLDTESKDGSLDLSTIIKNLNKKIKETDGGDELSFLNSKTKVDEKTQLMFDIVKDIYLTKVEEADNTVSESVRKRDLDRLLEMKANRQREAEDKMSDDELNKRIEELQK